MWSSPIVNFFLFMRTPPKFPVPQTPLNQFSNPSPPLQGFQASNKDLLPTLPIQLFHPLDLGEGPGTGPPKGPNLKSVGAEGGISTLHDLVEFGIKNGHGAVSTVVRLREELARVKTLPVLIAVDEVKGGGEGGAFIDVVVD